jgi:hypothetical protein
MPQPFLDVTLRLELGDLLLQGYDLGQISMLLAIAGERCDGCRRGLPHPTSQHALGQIQIPGCLRHRNGPFCHQLHSLKLELLLELPPYHV